MLTTWLPCLWLNASFPLLSANIITIIEVTYYRPCPLLNMFPRYCNAVNCFAALLFYFIKSIGTSTTFYHAWLNGPWLINGIIWVLLCEPSYWKTYRETWRDVMKLFIHPFTDATRHINQQSNAFISQAHLYHSTLPILL